MIEPSGANMDIVGAGAVASVDLAALPLGDVEVILTDSHHKCDTASRIEPAICSSDSSEVPNGGRA